MYRIKLQSGEESEFSSFEELCFGIVSGIIGPDDEIYHARASKWLPIQSHPDYKRAIAQAPPPSPAMVSQSPSSPAAVVGSDDPPDEEGGLDLMTLLDLEELTAFDPGKVQESAPLPEEADSQADTAELEPIEAQEPATPETNGHGAKDHDVAGRLEEPAADIEDTASLEPEEATAEMDAGDLADEAQAELGVDKETQLDDRDEATMAELALADEEAVAEMEDHDSATDDVMADGLRDIDYVAAEDHDDAPMMDAPPADPDTVENQEVEDDETDVAILDDLPATEHAEGSQDIDYIAAEDDDDVPMMESAVAGNDTGVAEYGNIEPVAANEDEDEEATADDQTIDQVADLDDDAADDEAAVEDDEDDEPASQPALAATLEVEEETVEDIADVDDGDTDKDVSLETEPVAQADDEADDDDDMADGDPLMGGTTIELDGPTEDELADTGTGDEFESEEQLVAAGDVADPIEAFQPTTDDDQFRDTFSPVPELDSPRRFPVVPAAIAAGVVAMAALGWVLMGAGGSDEPASDPNPQAPAPAAVVPTPNPDLNQQSLAAEDPSEDVQRRYDEAYGRARSLLDADLRRAGLAAVFAPGNFATEGSMVTARAAIAAASLAVTAYAGREQAIRDDFPDADPTGKESRVHRELAEDLLAVSQRVYGLLLSNPEAFALRGGAMTITDSAVESEYTRLLGEVNRLMALAATADDEQAATLRRIAAGIGNTRPPALAELAPPPALPTDL